MKPTANAGYSGRFLHSSIVYNNYMWVIGGGCLAPGKDVWYSP